MKYLAVLGRLPKLSLAELESLFDNVEPRTPALATFLSDEPPDINRLGGTQKIGVELPDGFNYLIDSLADLPEGKITLGVSDFRKRTNPFKAQGEALKIKKLLARRGRSVRVLQNKTAVLSTATSHHNQLAEKQNHLEIMLTDFGNFQLTGVQNITEYAKRDKARPARDTKVGMLPPKLAQILINLCGPLKSNSVVLDPFCGTGVVLQEASLMGYQPYGTDLSEKMVDYSRKNLDWLGCKNYQRRRRRSFPWPANVSTSRQHQAQARKRTLPHHYSRFLQKSQRPNQERNARRPRRPGVAPRKRHLFSLKSP